MHALEQLLDGNLPASIGVLIIAFFVLAKAAHIFVDSSISVAHALKIPRLLIGIVLVSLATTAPELAVSVMSALRGSPEMALGNAVGSVICDDGLALALCGILAPSAIYVMPRVLLSSGAFLVVIYALCYGFLTVWTPNVLNRGEGLILVTLFVGYMAFLYQQHRAGKVDDDEVLEELEHTDAPLKKAAILFGLGLIGILIASEFIITAAQSIAATFHIPEAIVALTIVALGTSIPEVATCVVAARKGEGALAVGNILGADIMNICWVAGASAIANDLTVGAKETGFMFPWMFAIVALMLGLLWWRHTLTRGKGVILLAAYVAYLASFVLVYPPGG